MSMLYEGAQSASYSMEYYFTFFNLTLLQRGLSLNSDFYTKLEKLSDYNSMDTIPSPMCWLVLDEVFDEVTLEEDCCHYTEKFTIEDELFSLISSGDYVQSTSASKLESTIEQLAWSIQSDLHYVLEGILDEEVDEYGYMEDEELGGKYLMQAFQSDYIDIYLYRTEDIVSFAECMIDLKEVLVKIKEDLNAINKNVAA